MDFINLVNIGFWKYNLMKRGNLVRKKADKISELLCNVLLNEMEVLLNEIEVSQKNTKKKRVNEIEEAPRS
jgi:hypothetical protein